MSVVSQRAFVAARVMVKLVVLPFVIRSEDGGRLYVVSWQGRKPSSRGRSCEDLHGDVRRLFINFGHRDDGCDEKTIRGSSGS